jgi:hypothetical protein
MVIASAMFYEAEDVERAVKKLKAIGVREKDISTVKHSEHGPVFVNGTQRAVAMGHGVAALGRALRRWGIQPKYADYISDEVHQGGVFLAVDLGEESIPRVVIEAIYHECNGRLTAVTAA